MIFFREKQKTFFFLFFPTIFEKNWQNIKNLWKTNKNKIPWKNRTKRKNQVKFFNLKLFILF
jgi:hypothetical protein